MPSIKLTINCPDKSAPPPSLNLASEFRYALVYRDRSGIIGLFQLSDHAIICARALAGARLINTPVVIHLDTGEVIAQ